MKLLSSANLLVSFPYLSALVAAALLSVAHLSYGETTETDKSTTTQQNQRAQQLRNIPTGVPVVMLNMLNFRDTAIYPNETSTLTGEAAYAKYREGASKLVAKVGGELIWKGDAKAAMIAPEGEHWDQVFLVRYPSIQKFFEMVNSEAYQQVVIHRTAALEDSRLIVNVESH